MKHYLYYMDQLKKYYQTKRVSLRNKYSFLNFKKYEISVDEPTMEYSKKEQKLVLVLKCGTVYEFNRIKSMETKNDVLYLVANYKEGQRYKNVAFFERSVDWNKSNIKNG